MTETWDTRIDRFWDTADDAHPAAALDGMRALVAEREANDPDAVYEWASIHDFLGREAEAVPLYEAALAAGLAGERRPQAVIQLASSLRNLGRAAEAIELLRGIGGTTDPVVGNAHQAFLALALHDQGAHDEALSIALRALAPTLPRYQRSVAAYADALTDGADAGPGSEGAASTSADEPLIERAWNAEIDLLSPATRSDPRRVAALLAPEFQEIGQSGREWDRETVIAALAAETGDETGETVLSDRAASVLAPGLVQLRYRLRAGGRLSLRSALWRASDDHVQCVFHQGTPAQGGNG